MGLNYDDLEKVWILVFEYFRTNAERSCYVKNEETMEEVYSVPAGYYFNYCDSAIAAGICLRGQDEAIRKALQEALEGAAEKDKEEITEGVLDSFSTDSAGDWSVAHYQDDLAWNYFHIQVQKHIRRMNSSIRRDELSIAYKDNGGNPTGKTGRADLFLVGDNNITYLWEVKPASYLTGSKREQAEAQLDGYVASDETYKRGGTQIKGGHFTAEYEKYKIT